MQGGGRIREKKERKEGHYYLVRVKAGVLQVQPMLRLDDELSRASLWPQDLNEVTRCEDGRRMSAPSSKVPISSVMNNSHVELALATLNMSGGVCDSK